MKWEFFENMPAPHKDKLNALLKNKKLPRDDKPRIENVIERYKTLVKEIAEAEENQFIVKVARWLDEYIQLVEVDLIFASENDFLYRQKGQTKIVSSILEEFVARIIVKYLDLKGIKFQKDAHVGPLSALTGLYFLNVPLPILGGNTDQLDVQLRKKDYDVAIGRPLYIQVSTNESFHHAESVRLKAEFAFLAIETKTNLDKTMFQEAIASATSLKSMYPSARYYLVCEWLDMRPTSSRLTPIDEVLVLRKAKRTGASERSRFSIKEERKKYLENYRSVFKQNPIREDVLERLVNHVFNMFRTLPDENEILSQGFF